RPQPPPTPGPVPKAIPPTPPSPPRPLRPLRPPAPNAPAASPPRKAQPPGATPPTPIEKPQARSPQAPAPPARRPAPAAKPRPAEPRPAPPPATPPPPVPSRDVLSVPEVIYVEDDAALAELLEYGLRAHGYRFLAYRNGRDALRELLALDVRGTHPLLLLDVDLPALDGYSILAALERERPGTYRVVFTTVHGTEEEQLRGLEAGALDYLVKPISLRVALEKIKRWVGRGKGGRGGRWRGWNFPGSAPARRETWSSPWSILTSLIAGSAFVAAPGPSPAARRRTRGW